MDKKQYNRSIKMDIESAIRQYLNLKNRLIPSTETEIYTLKRGIPKKVKSLKKIKINCF